MDLTKRKEIVKQQLIEIVFYGLVLKYERLANTAFDKESKEKWKSLVTSRHERLMYLMTIIDTEYFIVESELIGFTNELNKLSAPYEMHVMHYSSKSKIKLPTMAVYLHCC